MLDKERVNGVTSSNHFTINYKKKKKKQPYQDKSQIPWISLPLPPYFVKKYESFCLLNEKGSSFDGLEPKNPQLFT